VTRAGEADADGQPGDELKLVEAKRNLVKAWTRRRDKPVNGHHEPWTKTDWVGRAPGVTAQYTRAAFDELADSGRIESVDGNRDKGSKYRLVIVPGEVL